MLATGDGTSVQLIDCEFEANVAGQVCALELGWRVDSGFSRIFMAMAERDGWTCSTVGQQLFKIQQG